MKRSVITRQKNNMTLAPRKSHKKSHHVPLPCETKKTKLQPTSKQITLKAITHNKKQN